MARFSSLARASPPHKGQPGSTRVRCCFGRFGTKSLEELNNYSGQMARYNMAIQLGKMLSARSGRERRGLPAAPPGTGAAQDQAGDDQGGAEPDRKSKERKARDQCERASERCEFVAAKAGRKRHAHQNG